MSTSIILRPNGPLIARGNVIVYDADSRVLLQDKEAYLCRCGYSANKPFCDGAHKHCGFSHDAQFHDDKPEALEQDKAVEFSLRRNAMLIAKGPMTIQSEDGRSVTTRNKAAFCRCGESAKKPFCDVSHKRCGFSAE